MTEFWSRRRVLVTGLAGFVGSNLVRALLDAGADVAGLDLVTASPSLRALDVEVQILKRDVRDDGRLAWGLMNGNGELDWRPPEVLIHLAGVGHVHQAQQDPLSAWQVNVQGTWNLLEACRSLPAGQLKAVVLASSNHVFGSLNPGAVPAIGPHYPTVRQDSARTAWLEDDPCGATDVYGTSKGCVDLLARAYAAMGVPVVGLRHVNAAGAADPHRSHLITGTICDLLEGKSPLIRSDGTPLKAYLHVRDVVGAYLILAERLANGNIESGKTWNAAPQGPISVLALVDLLIQISGRNVVPNIRAEDLSQSGYVEHLDSSRLREMGWQPEDIYQKWLAEVWAWYNTHAGMDWMK